MYIGLVGLLLILLVVLGAGAFRVPADAIASISASTPAGRVLVERFVGRSRRFRTIGGAIGIVVSMIVTTSGSEQGSGVTVGFLPALGGAVLGSILAESFRVRRSQGARTAALGVRDETDYRDPIADSREWIVGAVCSVLTVVAVLHTAWMAVGLGAGVGAAALVRRWAQRQVVLRGRPALEPGLREADDEVRRMAVRHGLARPAVTFMALLVAFQAASLQARYPEVGIANTTLGVLSLVLSVMAIVWWWTNRNFGLSSVTAKRAWAVSIGGLVAVALVFLLLISARSML